MGAKFSKKEKKEKDSTNDGDNKLTMVYKISKNTDNIRILGKQFVKNNQKNCKLFINKKEYDICEFIEYDKYGINRNDALFTIILSVTNNEQFINLSYMFF